MSDDEPVDLRVLWDFDDPAGSEARFRDLADRSSGEQRELALSQVARALSLQERFEEAYAVLDDLGWPSPEVQARRFLERGRLHRAAGDPEAAAEPFIAAALRAAGAGLEELHVDALHMLALVAPPEERVHAHEVALAIARAATDPRARDWDASLLNNLGMVHAEEGDLGRALETFEQALAARERIGDPARTRVARWMIAWTLRQLGRLDEARAIQLTLREEHRAAGTSDVYVEEELALLEPSAGSTPGPGPTEGATPER
ncbi:tetratricopeptide repeat protein [Ornithinimicrobium tianjinense]|uniref:Tetratricopeptide repeat-containing protein n=1 Tax=Ornithinimicrobium tianjinense TaxID=1195761 RepID=A0A917BJ15_9MICO|nr:tetratricopeptide repeat protein [Ornithinimicrobium tianjinense]GGF45538.1 hypothetical protein GCM10011366_11580 [Ornithinimicrobium tianjinense]